MYIVDRKVYFKEVKTFNCWVLRHLKIYPVNIIYVMINSISGACCIILTLIHPTWFLVMHYISNEAKYQYVCHCSVCCIDSVDAVRTDYNHTNPSISAFIRHFSRKLERITITICGKGSQTTENEDNSVLVRTWKWRWKSTWKSFVFPPDLKKFLLFFQYFSTLFS